jgi:hypothetical protein
LLEFRQQFAIRHCATVREERTTVPLQLRARR